MPKPKKARYFLKIQDGCNMSCTYCIVSKVRPHLASKPIEAIEKEILWACGLGHKEVVLVGANIGLYGQDTNQGLDDLLSALARMNNNPRFRLSSTEPLFITAHLISQLKELPLCRHFHIPVQSADNNLLQKMKRGYDVTYLSKTIDLIHKSFPDVAIGADIIAGFPGEGKKEFMNTYQFLYEKPFTHLHVFPYSPRPGTEAYALGDPVARSEKRDRLQTLRQLIKNKNHEFRQRLLHKKFWVIIERTNGECVGLTDNYLRVEIDQPCPENELVEVMITDVTPDTTRATLCNRDVSNA